ncbi:hypothetical protein GCM10025780_25020 [Frondihabitans cladoniiphilus]|uniref:DUF559 domain-containing protein n=1 Tax=Frondihabitans cladoniiphilus TaxID=715785 RepID=A0ABP8W2K7_9MICO
MNGLPASAPGDAWAECRELLTVDELVILGDALVSPWSPVPENLRPSIADLESTVAAVPDRRERLRQALTWIRVGSRSPAETRLRLLLARHGIEEPELNAPVDARDGRVLGHGDMVFRAPRVVVEYEGERHFTQTETYYADIDRRERFAEAGWRTVRVTAAHLRQPADLVARITRHVGVRLQH